MTILAIDTSCDETAAAITADTKVLSSVVWSQSQLHSSFGGVMPSLAKRKHEERIEAVIRRALGKKHKDLKDIDAIAVTIGPGLSIALGVGVNMAKMLSETHSLPIIPVNHIEAHLYSAMAIPLGGEPLSIDYPALGLVVSGGTTELYYIKNVGEYKLLAKTSDDAIGEALDKSARLMGLGYPGGPVMEIFAKKGNPERYTLPVPLKEDVVKNRFSYSGVKTAFVRLFKDIPSPTKEDLYNLAASFQNTAFKHIENVLTYQYGKNPDAVSFIAGGGVMRNNDLRKRLRSFCKKNKLKLFLPYSKKLCTDNAAMVGVIAYLKSKNIKPGNFPAVKAIDRNPRLAL